MVLQLKFSDHVTMEMDGVVVFRAHRALDMAAMVGWVAANQKSVCHTGNTGSPLILGVRAERVFSHSQVDWEEEDSKSLHMTHS